MRAFLFNQDKILWLLLLVLFLKNAEPIDQFPKSQRNPEFNNIGKKVLTVGVEAGWKIVFVVHLRF